MDGNLYFSVDENAVVDLGESLLSNTTSGDFTVEGTLRVGSGNPNGVLQVGSSGNINVLGSVNFLNGSILEYNGISQQFINNVGFDDTILKINNVNGVTLLEDIQSGGLFIENGNLNTSIYSCSISGDVTLQNGTIAGSGTLVLNGSNNQLLSANDNPVQNFNVAKTASSDVTLTSSLSITGLLSILSTNSNVLANGNLTLVSASEAANGAASISALPAGSSIVGDVTVQRYMSGIGDKYRYISSPIATATVQSLKNAVPVTGTFADPSTGPGLNSSAPSLFEYDEIASQWKPYPTSGLAANNLFMPGRGYCYFNWNNTVPTLWRVTGTVNQGDIPFTLTYTNDGDEELDGWNLIGNPYPSAIRWDNGSGWQRNSSVSMGIAVRDNAINGFRYWDDGIGGLTDGRIALGQSFWVRTTGSNPQLTIRESAKVTDGAAFYRKSSALDYVELEIRINESSDKTFLRHRKEAVKVLDNYDIPKLANDFLSVSFITDDSVSVALNAIGEVPCHLEIPIKISTTKPFGGTVFFSVNSFGLFNGSDFHLYYEKTGEMLNLQPEGSFITLPGTGTILEGLKLIIDSPIPQEVKILAPSFVCEMDSFNIQPEVAQEGIVYELMYDDQVIDDNFGEGRTMSGKDLKAESNIFKLAGRSACSSRIMDSSAIVKKILTKTPEASGGFVCQAGEVTLSVKEELPIIYHWYETSAEAPILYTGSNYVTPFLVKSKTYFVSAVDALGCESQRTPVFAEVIPYDSVVIKLQDGVLYSSYEEGNQWFFNGAELPGETNQTLVPFEAGIYSVEVTMDPCQLRNHFEYAITAVTEESRLDDILIYPHPCQNQLFIRFRSKINMELIDVLSSSGVSVHYLCAFECNNEICEMNTTHLPNGLYILVLNVRGNSHYLRFAKH